MDLDLGGKRVLITSGSKGIGLSCAMVYAREGARSIIAACNADQLAAAAAEIAKATGVDVETHAVNLATQAGIDTLVAAVGDLDILVNNAGAIPGGNLETLGDARWREAWELKVFGYINMTRAWLPKMRARRSGVIANVIGIVASGPKADYVSGATANAGLVAFTRAVGGESTRDGVCVFGVNPGQTRTDRIFKLLRERAANVLGDAERWQELMVDSPLRRLMEPDEVANTIAFCTSQRCGYLSSTVIDMDGGALYAPPPRKRQ
jgi:3-oxoacyl-[acyl-carrier protein] reductase